MLKFVVQKIHPENALKYPYTCILILNSVLYSVFFCSPKDRVDILSIFLNSKRTITIAEQIYGNEIVLFRKRQLLILQFCIIKGCGATATLNDTVCIVSG